MDHSPAEVTAVVPARNAEHMLPRCLEALRQSLARLQLAYVLRKHEGGEYRFAIPLLQDQFEPSEVELLLHQELAVAAQARPGSAPSSD